VLWRQSAAGRAHEGAAGGDDGSESARHSRLVPEQALQGQEEDYSLEADAGAAEGGCSLPLGCLLRSGLWGC